MKILKFVELLKNDTDTNINDNWDKISNKFEEEAKELLEAIEEKDNKHILEEVQDVIQVTLRVLKQLEKNNVDIKEGNKRHIKKLVNRKWKIGKVYKLFY